MRRAAYAVALLAAILLAPGAGAWSARWSHPVDGGLGVDGSLLLAGDISASGSGLFALAQARSIEWGGGAAVRACPDRAGQPDPHCPPTPASVLTGATMRVLAGGLVVHPLASARVEARAPATSAMLGGAELVLNTFSTGPALFAAGGAQVDARGQDFLVRPLGRDARFEVSSHEGVRTFEGSGFTLRVSGVEAIAATGDGLVLALREGDLVHLSRAGLQRAESDLRLDDLLTLQRKVLPPGQPARRSDLAHAFGPFQVVPALLDGVVAAHAGLRIGDEPQEGFALLRVESARVRLEGDQWVGEGDASYLVQGDVVVPRPGARVDPPVVAPLVLGAVAVGARLLTRREAPAAARRRWAWGLRVAGLAMLTLLADLVAAPLLGVHPLLDGGSLTDRSRAQLGLLAGAMALGAWALVGWPVESLARSAFALRARPAARVLPVLLGLLAAGVMLVLGEDPLLSLAARYLRL